MVFIRKRKRGNKFHYYLVVNQRIGKKVQQKFLMYLGSNPEEAENKRQEMVQKLYPEIKWLKEESEKVLEAGYAMPEIERFLKTNLKRMILFEKFVNTKITEVK